MSNKKKKNNYYKKNNYQNTKKVLDGIDISKDSTKEKEIIKEDVVNNIGNTSTNTINDNNKNFNDHIQSFTSILFTIIIFIALILLIFVLYNNYLKKEEVVECDKQTVCQEYFKKDYGIKEEDVKNFIIDSRSFLYNFYQIDTSNLKNDDLRQFITYYIWGLSDDYMLCFEDDENCLVSKKEFSYSELNQVLKKYFNLDNLNVTFDNNFSQNDKVRLYLQDDKIVLTFSEFTFETLKHDIATIDIDSDEIRVIFVLARRSDDDYSYAGLKTINLKYIDSRFVIQKIETKLIN